MPESRNRLGDEKSPYLLQHKENPVHWYAWGEEAFEAAKARDVPVFLSIGYSTCHWCHVMEHESFENDAVAAVLNEHFVSIKVDREERPDIDAIYMDAVQAMTGGGGWPMTVFLTHDRKPFFGGTYFPRERFVDLLGRITQAWGTSRAQIVEQGNVLAEAIARQGQLERAGSLDDRPLVGLLDSWATQFDATYGGRRGRPKFPSAADLRVLLRVHRRSGDERALQMTTKTLDAMARGGMYDHLGGGFARYSVDERWLVPHFEKMLYDQATLTRAYVEAWEATGEREYELIARETLDYVLRDMTHPEGGFYSAEDADSEGEEGKFYVWTAAEIAALLGEKERAAFTKDFGISERGNFEHGTNILALKPGATRTERADGVRKAMKTLFDAREKRIHPHLDDKILTDWNGMMIAAMAQAGRSLGEPRYVRGAERAARFVLDRLKQEDGTLLHRWRDGEAGIPAFLDDYAYFVDGLLELYQADFDPRWLTEARALQERQDVLFRDETSGDYYATDGRDPSVLVRRIEPFDNVRPAGRSTTAHNLLRLADLTLDASYRERAAAVFATTPNVIDRAPGAFADLLIALDHALDRSKEIAIVGDPGSDGARAMLAALRGRFLPNRVVAVGGPFPALEPDADSHPESQAGTGRSSAERLAAAPPAVPLLAGKPQKKNAVTAYVCENGSCRLPTTDPAAMLEQAATFTPLLLSSDPEPDAP